MELREAAQALLLRELNRIAAEGRQELVVFWASLLPTPVEPSLFGTSLAGCTVSVVATQANAEETAKHGPTAAAVTPIRTCLWVLRTWCSAQ
jgi:hypothetical protein